MLQLCFISRIQEFCGNVETVSDPAQPPYSVFIRPINYSSVKQRGIDFDVTYAVPLDRISGDIPGRLTVRGLATHYIRSFTDDGFSPTSDIAGVNAPGGLNGTGGLPSWTYRIEANYAVDRLRLNLTGRGLSRGKVSNEYTECNGNCPISTLANRTINDNRIAGAFYLDGSVAYRVPTFGGTSELFFTVRNLLNRDPVLIPLGGVGTAVTSSSQQQTNVSLYDVLGRSFRFGIRAEL